MIYLRSQNGKVLMPFNAPLAIGHEYIKCEGYLLGEYHDCNEAQWVLDDIERFSWNLDNMDLTYHFPAKGFTKITTQEAGSCRNIG
jgi:hypothetical protein